MGSYPAHIQKDDDGSRRIQTVEEHCRACARYAMLSVPVGLKKNAYLAGLIHDMGKYTDAFREYIELASEGVSVRRGSVNHTFTAAHFVMECWHTDVEQSYRNLTSELIAFASASHHGQFDCINPDGKDGFQHRIEFNGPEYKQAKENFLKDCAGMEELNKLFEEAVQEIQILLERFIKISNKEDEVLFYLAMLARIILSAVIEGDRRDTHQFKLNQISDFSETDLAERWTERLSAVEQRLSRLPVRENIDLSRRRISDICKEAAGRLSGIFRLTVPTGGGKTLATLRYALTAATHEKKRIFFCIPLLSVLEQNAKVIHDYLEDDSMILECHSHVIQEKTENGEMDDNELLMDSWQEAPVIITTLVQLLQTLFDGRTTCIRRMNALSDSVIIIDEIQSVPKKMLTEFNLALNFLSEFCGATVVLCSATQPCLDYVEHPIRYADEPELVPYDSGIWERFRRTQIIDCRKPQGYTINELADFSVDCADKETSLLLICNTKREARKLFETIQNQWDGQLFHLSTAMCMQHRINTLKKIMDALAHKERVICVSTQLVEAGVDFSFGCVIRILAGMENISQAAGRCNRSGEYGKICPVYIVNLQNENLSRLKEIKQSQQATESLLLSFKRNSEIFPGDLTGEAAIKRYYQTLYTEMNKNAQDYPITKYGTTLFDFLSVNRKSGNLCRIKNEYMLGQAFQTAGKEFRVFDENTWDVIVPYGEGENIIQELSSQWTRYDIQRRKNLIRKAGLYTVSLYEYELKNLEKIGAVYAVCDGSVLVLTKSCYSEELGVHWDDHLNLFMEV